MGLIRVLILEPKVFILDETIFSPDMKNSKEISKFLYYYRQENLIFHIFITHQDGFFVNFKRKKMRL